MTKELSLLMSEVKTKSRMPYLTLQILIGKTELPSRLTILKSGPCMIRNERQRQLAGRSANKKMKYQRGSHLTFRHVIDADHGNAKGSLPLEQGAHLRDSLLKVALFGIKALGQAVVSLVEAPVPRQTILHC